MSKHCFFMELTATVKRSPQNIWWAC